MRTFDAKIDDQKTVEKLLRSLNSKYNYVITIEESKDLSAFSFDELMGSLQVYDVRINRKVNKKEKRLYTCKTSIMTDEVVAKVNIMVHLEVESLEEEEYRDMVLKEVDLMIIIKYHV